ncbi:hypothetical protein GCM10023147_33370 [Tsukamurella soli]|uniref:Uncharacterized protein n=1 Tax=Tsukamurella soli TaxID=644556 RepID=A0ABP8JXS0_9ACTN
MEGAQSARSYESTSIVNHPAIRSLVSGCGASVVTGAASGPVPHPGPRGREPLRIDEFTTVLEHFAHMSLERDVRLDVLGCPLIHRRERVGPPR